MRSGLKLALVTLPLALVGVGILAFIIARNPPPDRNELAERATAVRVIVAQSQAVAPVLTGFGVVNPARTFEAIAEVGGTAEYVNPSLDQGAIIPAGDVLLRLSPTDFNRPFHMRSCRAANGRSPVNRSAAGRFGQAAVCQLFPLVPPMMNVDFRSGRIRVIPKIESGGDLLLERE